MLPSIHVKLRKDKPKDGKMPIVLQLYHNKKQKQYFTGLYIEEKFFQDGKILPSYLHSIYYNKLIKDKIAELENSFLKQTLEGQEISMDKKKHSKKNFFEYAYEMYKGMKNRCSPNYIDRSIAALENFETFAGSVNFQAITPQLLKNYEDHLFKNGLQRNTINRIYKRIKQVFTQAVKDGTTEVNPFNTYKPVTYKQPKRSYLTIDEMKLIEHVEIPQELEHIRNYFLLSCYTGLRFSDLQTFNPAKAITRNKGVERIIIGTTKTGEVVSIKLNQRVKSIIEKLNKPLPSNVHTNRLLKIIGEAAELDKPLNFHMARHSAAVNMASAGLSIEVVGRILGHTDIRTTAIYYKITDSKIDEAMDTFHDFAKDKV